MKSPWSINIEALHTVTLHRYIYRKREEGDEPPWSIDHRGLSYHYTAYIYIKEMKPPGQLSIEALHTITLRERESEREEGHEPPGQWSIEALLGLSYSIYKKTYGDAPAKPEKSSNFQIYLGKTDDETPPFETVRAQSEPFAVQCRQ